MLDDDKVTITAQTRACINHFTVCSSYDGLTSITADVHAFIAAAKVGKEVTVGRTLPYDAADCTGCTGSNCRRIERCRSRLGNGCRCRI